MATSAAGALVVFGFALTATHHATFLAEHPGPLVWVAGGLLAGLAAFRANRIGMPLAGPVASWLGAGVLAVVVGFALQNLVNGNLSRVLPVPLDATAVLILAVGAALCQTSGKLVGIALVLWTDPPRGPRSVLAAGLAVGLGFGLTEVLLVGQRAVAYETDTGLLPWMGIWERAAAVAFHVYSGGLLAVSLRRRVWQPLAIVLSVHVAMDTVAGAVGSLLVTVPLVLVELGFTAGALVVWAAHLRVARRALADGAPW
jgi:hypothetical protein